MSEQRLSEEQRRLIAAASRYRETEDRNAMERALARQDADISTYVVEAPCSVCADPLTRVQVHPRWIHAARCARCIERGYAAPRAPMPDDREPTITWERLRESFVIEATPEGIEKHPEPVVTSLDPVPEGTEPPAAVRGLQGRAEALGWSVNLTYARGNGVHGATGRPTKLVDSWAVRCWRGRKRAVAVYSGGAWGDMWGIEHMFHARTLDQFTAYLSGVDDAWLRRTRVENLIFEAHEPCTSGEVHGGMRFEVKGQVTDYRDRSGDPYVGHAWWKKGGAGRWCPGRDTTKSKKTKEAGG